MTSLGRELLRHLDGEPIGFVDIGARGGVHPLVSPVPEAVAVLAFEPDSEECERMRADPDLQGLFAKFEIAAAALADKAGPATLYDITAPTNSSLRRPNQVFVDRYAMAKWRVVKEIALQTTTLDEVVFDNRSDHSWGEALKIDTQGTEYEILCGAKRTLSERTQFLCVEVSFCELYQGQRMFSDVEEMLRGLGFSFYGFDRVYNRSRKSLDKSRYWGRERSIQADAYFFKDPFDSCDGQVAKRQQVILATFALMTGYHDFALELLDKLESFDVFSLRQAVLTQAQLSSADDGKAVKDLAAAVEAKPNYSSLLVAKFVDGRRSRNDVFDIPDAVVS